MHCKCVSEIRNRNYFSTQRPIEALYLTVSKTIKTQLQLIWSKSCLKELEHDVTYEILTNLTFRNQLGSRH